jgi:hypothetical protein
VNASVISEKQKMLKQLRELVGKIWKPDGKEENVLHEGSNVVIEDLEEGIIMVFSTA